MSEQVLSKDKFHAWVDARTRQLDIVASWESLVGVYEQLSFLDGLTDDERIEEFNWIIHMLNKQLTRMRKALMSCAGIAPAIDYLGTQYDCKSINSRKMLAYAKYKQALVRSLIMELEGMEDE